MRETAFAKLNLALHVRARESDGYHRIETVFAFCEDGDVLTAEPADRLSLDLTGPFAADLTGEPDNLVLRAARNTRLSPSPPRSAANGPLTVSDSVAAGSAVRTSPSSQKANTVSIR